MRIPDQHRGERLWQKATGLILFSAWLAATPTGARGQTPSLTEYQVKALFLLNFAKYVDWPEGTFAQPDSPITIGVLGEDPFGADLKKAVAGRAIGGRKVVIQEITHEDDWNKCRILFISASEKKRLAEILGKVKTMPILTVGESEQFTQQGGVLNFMRKEGKIRFEVDLNAAHQAGLRISSKLLSVADIVHGRPD